MKLLSFKDFLFEAKKKKDDEVEVDVTQTQQAYYKDLPKSTAQKKKSQAAKQADMANDDPDAYEELPGDKKAQRQGKVKTSEYTKAYHKKYGKKESVDENEYNVIGKATILQKFLTLVKVTNWVISLLSQAHLWVVRHQLTT